jgi:hypothetical protein
MGDKLFVKMCRLDVHMTLIGRGVFERTGYTLSIPRILQPRYLIVCALQIGGRQYHWKFISTMGVA